MCGWKPQASEAPGERTAEAEELSVIDTEGGGCGWKVGASGGGGGDVRWWWKCRQRLGHRRSNWVSS